MGAAEIARRKRLGWLAILASVGLLALLYALGAPSFARIVLALPATYAACEFLQARERFCITFGKSGKYNFGKVGSWELVSDPVSRAKDAFKRSVILRTSVATGLVVAVALVLA